MSKTTPPLYLRQLLTCRWRQSLPPVPFASRRQRRENNNVINKTKATKSYYRKISTSDHLSTKRQSGHCCVTVITSDRLMSKMNKWSINSIIFLYTEPFALSDCFYFGYGHDQSVELVIAHWIFRPSSTVLQQRYSFDASHKTEIRHLIITKYQAYQIECIQLIYL